MFQPGLITHKTNFSRVATVLERFIGTVLVLFFIGMVIFLHGVSVLRKTPFSASKYAKDMLAYRKRAHSCFMQQATALHEHRSKCCSMDIFNKLPCQKHMKRFEACIFSQKYFC